MYWLIFLYASIYSTYLIYIYIHIFSSYSGWSGALIKNSHCVIKFVFVDLIFFCSLMVFQHSTNFLTAFGHCLQDNIYRLRVYCKFSNNIQVWASSWPARTNEIQVKKKETKITEYWENYLYYDVSYGKLSVEQCTFPTTESSQTHHFLFCLWYSFHLLFFFNSLIFFLIVLNKTQKLPVNFYTKSLSWKVGIMLIEQHWWKHQK